jgi:hypothetical protein
VTGRGRAAADTETGPDLAGLAVRHAAGESRALRLAAPGIGRRPGRCRGRGEKLQWLIQVSLNATVTGPLRVRLPTYLQLSALNLNSPSFPNLHLSAVTSRRGRRPASAA